MAETTSESADRIDWRHVLRARERIVDLHDANPKAGYAPTLRSILADLEYGLLGASVLPREPLEPPIPPALSYTTSCAGPCNRVRGRSAFRVLRTGGRADVCRWCEQEAQKARDEDRAAIRKRILELKRLEGQYLRRLADVRAEIAEREALLAESTPARRSA